MDFPYKQFYSSLPLSLFSESFISSFLPVFFPLSFKCREPFFLVPLRNRCQPLFLHQAPFPWGSQPPPFPLVFCEPSNPSCLLPVVFPLPRFLPKFFFPFRPCRVKKSVSTLSPGRFYPIFFSSRVIFFLWICTRIFALLVKSFLHLLDPPSLFDPCGFFFIIAPEFCPTPPPPPPPCPSCGVTAKPSCFQSHTPLFFFFVSPAQIRLLPLIFFFFFFFPFTLWNPFCFKCAMPQLPGYPISFFFPTNF